LFSWNPSHAKSFVLAEIAPLRGKREPDRHQTRMRGERTQYAAGPDHGGVRAVGYTADAPRLVLRPLGKVFHESDPSDIAAPGRSSSENEDHNGASDPPTARAGSWISQPYPNVFIDTSGSQPFSGYRGIRGGKLGAERIVLRVGYMRP